MTVLKSQKIISKYDFYGSNYVWLDTRSVNLWYIVANKLLLNMADILKFDVINNFFFQNNKL